MNTFRKEYFNDNYYFLIEGDGEDFTLEYSIYKNISESKKKGKVKHFKKKDFKKIEDKIKNLIKDKKTPTKQEIDELVDEDGTLRSSRIPILNKWLTPRKTMDQTVVMARISNDPVTRGYRVYYGESENKDGDVIDEEDMSGVFGYKENENKDFKETVKTFKKMGVTDPAERIKRTKELGKLPNVKKKKGRLKQRLTEKEIEEERKNMMVKMVEDIISQNRKNDGELLEKDDSVSKILIKNLESIRNLAKKEGISLDKLINVLKKGE
jgi:hypothetical protein